MTAGQGCTIAVDVQAVTAGVLVTGSGQLNSDLSVNALGATAMLNVAPSDVLSFSAAFSPATVGLQGAAKLTFTIDNTANSIRVGALAFDQTLPEDGLVVVDPANPVNSFGGTFEVVAGEVAISLSGGVLAAGQACTIAVDVQAPEVGTLDLTSGDLTSDLPKAAAGATATLEVISTVAPGFSAAFAPDTVDPGGVATLTYRIDNGTDGIDVGALAFDTTFPDGLVVAAEPDMHVQNTCGGTVAPVQVCTISVDVQALRVGALEITSGALASDLPDAAPDTASGAAATLTVNQAPLTVSLAFDPAADIAQGAVSRLTYTLTNSVAVGATEVALSDTLPAGVLLAADPAAETGCDGGMLSAPAGGNRITFIDGALAADGADSADGMDSSCTISVNVIAGGAGSLANSTESVTSSLGESAPAEAVLMVTAAAAPGFEAAFAPDTVNPGAVSRLSYTIDNMANLIGVAGLPSRRLCWTDWPWPKPPTGWRPAAATRCRSPGGIAAGGACTVSVDLRALAAGVQDTESAALTST